MKFVLKNDFYQHDDKGQPYSVEVEKDNPYYHLNGKCDEKGYAILFSGARAYIDVPEVKSFHLSFYLLHNHSHAKIVPFDIVGCNRVRIDCLHTFVGADECIPIVYDGVPICRLFAKDLSVAVLNNAGVTDTVRHIRYTFVLG